MLETYAPMAIMAVLGLILGKILFSAKPDNQDKTVASKSDSKEDSDTDETYALEWRNRYLAARVKYLEERLSEKTSSKAKALQNQSKGTAKPKAKAAAKPKAKAPAKSKTKAAAKPKK